MSLQRHEEREIMEPETVFFAEGGVIVTFEPILKPPEGLLKKNLLVAEDGLEVDMFRMKTWHELQVGPGEQPVSYQELGTNEERIAGKRRSAVVGRAAAGQIRWIEGQNLPKSLLRLQKQVHEPVSGRPYISYPEL
jgi:hypothetical protein